MAQMKKFDIKMANTKFMNEFSSFRTNELGYFKDTPTTNIVDRIILVIYVGLGEVHSKPKMMEHMAQVKNAYNNQPDVLAYFIPAMGEINTRIECINPKLVSESEYSNAREILDKAQIDIDNFIRTSSKLKNDVEKL